MLLKVFCVNCVGIWGLGKNLEKRREKNKCAKNSNLNSNSDYI